MRKAIFVLALFSIVGAAAVACSSSEEDQLGAVRITGPTDSIAVNVSDPDGDGWQMGQAGRGTTSVDLTLTELTGRETLVTAVLWMIYDGRGREVASGTVPVGVTIAPDASVPVTLDITVGEAEADIIDDVASAPDDEVGVGRMMFGLVGYNSTNGQPVISNEGYAMLTVGPE